MEEHGLFLCGLFVGSDEVVKNYEQREVKQFVYLISTGTNAFRVTSDKDYRPDVIFGDEVTFSVRCRAYNNNVYYNGELVK